MKMIKTICLVILFMPVLMHSQSAVGISYEEGFANYQKVVEENKLLSD
jgi:hypothetical protein